jgi:hypothetical protein
MKVCKKITYGEGFGYGGSTYAMVPMVHASSCTVYHLTLPDFNCFLFYFCGVGFVNSQA